MDAGRTPQTPTQVAFDRIKTVRQARGLSGAAIGQRMAALGFAWDRNTIAKIEGGHRATLNVDELLGLARVLDVSPMVLLLPTTGDYPFAPDQQAESAQVYRWLVGRGSTPGTVPKESRSREDEADKAWSETVRLLPWLEQEAHDQRYDATSRRVQEQDFIIERLTNLMLDVVSEDQLERVAQSIELLLNKQLGKSAKERSHRSDTRSTRPREDK